MRILPNIDFKASSIGVLAALSFIKGAQIVYNTPVNIPGEAENRKDEIYRIVGFYLISVGATLALLSYEKFSGLCEKKVTKISS